jgi:MSHA biogenesis protein MshI
VISADDYQLVHIEAPDVLPAELRAAVRWRLRDAIDFPVEEATVDLLELPQQSRRANAKMVYAVAAQTAAVERLGKSSTFRSCACGIWPRCCRRIRKVSRC